MPVEPAPLASPLSPEQRGEDDRLEPPGVALVPVLAIAAGLVVFLAVSLALLAGFFRMELGANRMPPLKRFPDPRLETNIDPRTLPSTLPGPAQAVLPPSRQPDEQILQRAMQTVVARGAHAYDPLTAPTGQGAGR